MSEDLLYNSGRPRRTRSSMNSLATPTASSNPYKKPTYGSNLRRGGASPDESADEGSNDAPPATRTPPSTRRKPGRPFGSVTKNRSGTPRGSGGGGRRGGRGGRGGNNGTYRDTPTTVPPLTLRKRSSVGTVPSWSSTGTTKGRPECVASRNDSRKSLTGGGGGRGRKKRRGYSTADYHYGSDFESDQIDSDPDDDPKSETDSEEVEDDMPLDEPLESDSDLSVGSARLPGLPSIPVPLWLDPETSVEDLEIPRSSDDLLLPRNLLIDAIGVYEPLRRFSNLVRLTPFRFEDFCTALISEEQSVLLAEIHIQLLKALIREDESAGTTYGPNECKDSIQSTLFFAEYMTWAECLRAYVESDPDWIQTYKLLTSVEYPFCSGEIRLQILAFMVDTLMVGNSMRDLLTLEGKIVHEDHCRACNRLGELICCESCPAVYHLGCISLKGDDEDPPDDWKCPVCEKHELLGVTDCVSEIEKAGLLLRHESLGYDRHGRKYWFLIRRIIVESEDKSEVWYYSSRLQVQELLFRLDGDSCEKSLVENILYHKEEIYRQMDITERVTTKMNTNHRKTYLEAENAFLSKIHEEREVIRGQEAAEKNRLDEQVRLGIKRELEAKQKLEEEEKQKREDEKRRIREDRLAKRNQVKLKQRLGSIPDMDESLEQILLNDESKDSFMEQEDSDSTPRPLTPLENGDVKVKEEEIEMETQILEDLPPPHLQSEIEVKLEFDEVPVKVEPKEEESPVKSLTLPKIIAKSKSLNLEVDSEERMTRLRSTGLYKLGQEGSFRTYVNSYSTDVLALSKSQHTDERDKRRVMSHKFSLTQASDCKWSGGHQGLRTSIVNTIRQTLLNMEVAIPSTLMHVNWSLLRKTWIGTVSQCTNAREFSKALATFTAGLRPSILNPVWAEGVGHVKLSRTTTLQKEVRRKTDKLEKKFRDEEEDRLKLFPQFVKYAIPPKHQAWKQKGEEYRLHGNNGWMWLSKFRPAKPKDGRTQGLSGGPFKHVIQVKGNGGKVKTMLIDPDVYDKLMAKRAVSLEQKRPTPPDPEEDLETDVRTVMDSILDTVAGKDPGNSSSSTTLTLTPSSTKGTVMTTATASSATTTAPLPPPPEVTSPSRKFRTELINVSLAIVSANRILYPKIARESSFLDGLLQRRLTLQSLEEKELLEEFGSPMLESMKGSPPTLDESPIVIKIDSGFPLGGGYSLICFSYECRRALVEGRMNYESICYSPMCRLKAVIMNSRKKKVERERLAEFEKKKEARKKIEERRCYNQGSTDEKVFLKKLPSSPQPQDSQHVQEIVPSVIVKYPPFPKFCYNSTQNQSPSILVLPQQDLRQLARSGGRKLIPLGFTPNPRPNQWMWPYPSGRPLFRTTWQYRTAVQAKSLHAAAIQLRILYACVRWDDILMKPMNPDGKSEITTDMEVITSEILDHRIVGRFQEVYQYLRRRHIVPIDAPKTIRGKRDSLSSNSSEVTPSRSGLRKRKRAESPDNARPEVREEWVDEDKFEVWEIRLYGDKLERKNDKKPEPPSSSTRTKTGVMLKVPEKWDPSPKEKESQGVGGGVTVTKFLPLPTSSSSVLLAGTGLGTISKETEPELRIAHLSKRDHHPKILSNPNKIPTLTASQQVLSGGSPVVKAISLTEATSPSGRKYFTTKTIRPALTPGTAAGKETISKMGILKKPLISTSSVAASSLMNSTASPPIIRPVQVHQQQQQQLIGQKLVRTEDGTVVQVNGILPGQTFYQTADGTVHTALTTVTGTTTQLRSIAPAAQQVTLFRTQTGQLTQATPTTLTPPPRVNISNSQIRTFITPSPSPIPMQPRALVRPAEPRKPAIIKQAMAPSVIRVNKTAEDLKSNSLHLQVGRQTIEVNHQNVTKGPTGEDQIVLGPGLPIIQLLPARTRIEVVATSGQLPLPPVTLAQIEPPPLQQLQPITSSEPQSISSTAVVGSVPEPSTNSQGGGAGTKIIYNEGNRSFVLNTTGFTEAQVQALIQQLQEKKIVIKGMESTGSLGTAQRLTVPSQVILPQGFLTQPQPQQACIQGQQMFVQQSQQVLVQQPVDNGSMAVTSLASSATPTRMVTTLGGQRVFLSRPPTPVGPITRTITPVSGLSVSSQVFQKLAPAPGPGSLTTTQFLSPKTIISVTPPAGGQGGGTPPRQILMAPPQQMVSPTVQPMTRSPLPISIVSPSKPRATTPIRIQQPNTQQAQVMTAQQLTGLLQQRHVTAIPTSSPLASVRIPSSVGGSPVKTQFVQLHGPGFQHQVTTTMSSSLSSPRLPTILRPVTPVGNVVSSPRTKLTAQVVETPEGRCLKVQGIPPNISPATLAHLQAQIAQQLPQMGVSTGMIIPKEDLGTLLASAGAQVTQSSTSTLVTTLSPRPRLLTPATGRRGSPVKSRLKELTVPLPAPLIPSIPDSLNIDSTIGTVVMGDFGFDDGMTVAEEVTVATTKRPRTTSGPKGGGGGKRRKMNSVTMTPPEGSPILQDFGRNSETEATFVLTQDLVQSVPEPAGRTEEVVTTTTNPNQMLEAVGAGPPLDILEPPKLPRQTLLSLTPSLSEAVSTLLSFSPEINHQVSTTMTVSPKVPIVPSPATRTVSSSSSPLPVPLQQKSRRKSPVRSDNHAGTKGTNALVQKALQQIYRQKELLKTDMTKKRALMEKDIWIEIQDEIEELKPTEEESMSESGELEIDMKNSKRTGERTMKTNKGSASLPLRKAGSKRKSRKAEELYCSCQKPYDKNKLYVGCEKCDQWYHGDCVGITKEMSELLPEYVCLSCLHPPQAELYCVCKQPYDDTKFYIACDKCDDWLHGRCIGMLPIEGTKIESFACSSCDPSSTFNRVNAQHLKCEDYHNLEKVVKGIKIHKSASAFRKPVDASQAPNYFRVIKDPMDLCEIERRIEQRRYGRLPDFVADMSLIFDNCRYFNQPESSVCKAADVLEGILAQKLSLLREQLGASSN